MTAIKGVVVGHAGLAAALIGAVEQISGPDTGLVAISNVDCDRGTLEERIITAATPGPSLVFIDMPSGSCHFAAMRRIQSMPDVRVVTGVNLAMLLEFVFHREGALDEVATHIVDVGARAVMAR
jgi:PTS system mannose-specific IIA component